MQLAILIVLIIIAVVLAPWLLGVALALLALYGLWVLVAAIAAVVGLLVLAVALSAGKVLASRRPPSMLSDKTEQMIAKANEKFRADAAALDRSEVAKTMEAGLVTEEHRQGNYRECPSCKEQMPKYGLFCPHCGKDPKSDSKQ